MGDWLADNWPWLLAAAAYVVGRASGVSPMWKKIAQAVVEAIEAYGEDAVTANIKKTVKAKVPEGNSEMAEALTNAGDEKHREPVGKRILGFILKALPLVGRFIK